MNNNAKELLEYYRSLSEEAAQQLLEFAEFLTLRNKSKVKEIPPPEEIPRPEVESVVIAVKRLSATYPMLNKDSLLDKAASLMSQNMLQGRDAVEVIDELEEIFSQYYATMVEEFKQGSIE